MTWIAHSSGGGERSTIEFAEELNAQGNSISALIFSPDTKLLAQMSNEFGTFPFVKFYAYSERMYQYIVHRAIKNHGSTDVILSCRRTISMDHMLSMEFNIPVIAIAREILHRLDVANVVNYHKAHHIIAVSNAVRNRLIQLGFNECQVTTVLNGVKISDADRYLHSVHPNIFTFAYIGRLVKWKKVENFIMAARTVQEQCAANLRFIVIGDGPERYNLERFSISLGLDVDFIGWVNPIWNVNRLYDVLVVTTREEPFGRVIVESLAMGRPVIAPQKGGPMDIITNYRDGLFYEPNNIDHLAERMLLLVKNQHIYEMLKTNTFSKAKQFDIRIMANNLIQVIDEVIRRNDYNV